MTKMRFMLIISLLLQFHHTAFAQNPILGFLNQLETNYGYGWPHSVRVVEGHELLLTLTRELVNTESCTITTPKAETFDTNQLPSNKYERWSSCGVRVKNIVPADHGRWRVTARRGNDSVTGFSEVYVDPIIQSYTAPTIHLHDGREHETVQPTNLTNSYCLVTQPFTASTLIPGECVVTLDKTTRAVQGIWSVALGLPGMVKELDIERTVAVDSEHLDVGYIHDTEANKLHLYCNLLNSMKNVSFCRFHKTSEPTGYNVYDGLSDGQHSYYGEGFLRKQCGITVEQPQADDFTSWRCSVGVQELVNDVVRHHTPMSALMIVPTPTTRINRGTSSRDNEVQRVYIQRGNQLTISCRAEVPLTYCWFQAPSGVSYTPVEQFTAEQEFWYTGYGLSTGDCGITFPIASDNHTGLWACHMGPDHQLGLEITKAVEVRVTGPLASSPSEVDARIGSTVELNCQSSSGRRPLEYCRFLSPTFVGINVDETVSSDVAILNRYYFTPSKSLPEGYCSLTISQVATEDLGVWTCAAKLIDEDLESSDTVALRAGGTTVRFQAGLTFGIIGGAVLILVPISLLVWYKRVKSNRTDNREVEMEDMSDQRHSVSSGDSTSTIYSRNHDNRSISSVRSTRNMHL